MPTLPYRLLHQNRPSSSSSSDSPYIDHQVEEYYGRSPDEPSFGPGHRSKYSRLPSSTPQAVPRSEPLGRNSKSHTRSRSHPFPSLFGTGRKRGDSLSSKVRHTQDFFDEDEDDDDDDDYAPQLDGSSSPDRRKIVSTDPRKMEERDIEAERCMTCDSKVKRSKGHKTFRCGTCSTINDLESWNRQPSSQGRYEEPVALEQGISHSHTARKRESF